MPTYCYRVKKTGEVIERFFSMKDVKWTIRTKDGPAHRDITAERIGVPSTNGWPILSDALSVHPSQISEEKARLKGMGVPTDFTPDGRPVLKSRGHRREVLKACGMIDRNGGYGDG